MNVRIDRELVAQLVIVVAIAMGGWLMFVDPVARETAQLRADLREARSGQAPPGAATLEQVLARLETVRARTRAVVASNRLGEDTTRLYSTVRDLAEHHGITLRRLQPGRARPTPGKAAALNEMEMHFESSLDDLVAFVDAVESIRGFVRPESLTVTPLEEGMVSARYTCSVLHFPLEETLLQMEIAADAES